MCAPVIKTIDFILGVLQKETLRQAEKSGGRKERKRSEVVNALVQVSGIL